MGLIYLTDFSALSANGGTVMYHRAALFERLYAGLKQSGFDLVCNDFSFPRIKTLSRFASVLEQYCAVLLTLTSLLPDLLKNIPE